MTFTLPDRSDCVRITDGTDKIILHYGEGILYESLPAGTRVIYPPKPLPAIDDVNGAIAHALEHPLGCDPLSAQLKPGMKVTIVFDDISIPLPPMQRPDLRELIITQVLKKLADASITDIHLICAIALHRRMTLPELRYCLGDKIVNQYHPTGQLYNYDAEDKDGNILIGTTPHGEEVEISRRVVESDLVIYVNITGVSMSGGNKSFTTGVSTYRTIRHHHNHHTLMHCDSYMDPNPKSSALHASCNRMAKLIEDTVNIFKIETTLNNGSLPTSFRHMTRRYWEHDAIDRLAAQSSKFWLDLLPDKITRPAYQQIRAPYRLTSIQAGKTDLVHELTLENIYRQQMVPIQGQSDILIIGGVYLCPYNVNSIMNPILFHCQTMGYFFNFYRGKPVLRRGGVMIVPYPLHEDFNETHHPSYIEFYHRVLADTTDAKTLQDKYEEEFAYNPKYIDLYRNSYAYHGVHPFYMWYWGCYGFDYVGKMIVVQPRTTRPADRMGYATARSIPEAIEMAKDFVGPNPSITNMHIPPYVMCDVS